MGDNTPPSSSTFDPIQVLKQLRGGDGGINVNGGSVVSGVNVSIHRGEVKGGGGMTEGGIAGGTGGRKLNGSAEGVRVNARYDTPQHIYKGLFSPLCLSLSYRRLLSIISLFLLSIPL